VNDELDDPAVASHEYDEDYFRTCCTGAVDWHESSGRRIAGIYYGFLELANFQPGEIVVDLGTGRGELPVLAVTRGAPRAIGVEYSSAAIALARQTVEAHGVGDRVDVVQADARRIPVPDASADLVTLLDVVEHLIASELDTVLLEARRILRPGGRIFIHTFPTRTNYSVTYPLLRLLLLRRHWPRDPRNDYERRMHVNEQTVPSLRRSLRRAGFHAVDVRPGAMVYVDFIPEAWAQRLVRALAHRRLFRRLTHSDIVATGHR
jgi:cyclopropane fatty-acyl-phospholipid synthase-like methyltransferase